MLGQLPGVFNAGEMTWLFYALLGDGRCSCGAPLRSCAIWSAVFQEAFGDLDEIDLQGVFELRRRGSSRHLPTMVLPSARRRMLDRLHPLPERLEQLYSAIRSVTGADLIVDASKEPHYSWILRSRPVLDVHFVHLVRDPRAIAFSWARVKPETGFDGRVLLERRSALTSAIYHDVSNTAAEALWSGASGRYLRVRYEDLIADPVAAVATIGELVGRPLDVRPILEGSVADLGVTHSAWGNPNRFETGRVELRPDDEWRTALPRHDRWLTSLLTWPFLRRYHYPVRVS
jgi:hypothetical protein